jgi:hypothetical protein
MEVEGVGAVESSPRQPIQPIGITAKLAEARKKLREAAPVDRWEAVVAEAHRLQFEQGMSPLDALEAVYAKLASGWVPR